MQQLSGLIPICAGCKKIRDEQDFWQGVEVYLSRHTGAKFSHGLCPDCFAKERERFDRFTAPPRSPPL
ncbi:MAG: hypothetical protein HY302_14660 [Opitutae bacterium]|nr:hypothetical protein [Opitutae bacterium]